jgi:hypothetical protein
MRFAGAFGSGHEKRRSRRAQFDRCPESIEYERFVHADPTHSPRFFRVHSHEVETSVNDVFILYYDHEIPYEVDGITYFWDDIRLLGVYETESQAEHALDQAKRNPEFSSSPQDLSIFRCEIGRTFWEEGFFTWMPGEECCKS